MTENTQKCCFHWKTEIESFSCKSGTFLLFFLQINLEFQKNKQQGVHNERTFAKKQIFGDQRLNLKTTFQIAFLTLQMTKKTNFCVGSAETALRARQDEIFEESASWWRDCKAKAKTPPCADSQQQKMRHSLQNIAINAR